jgi:heat shock 70kDa protein 1/2/6/8
VVQLHEGPWTELDTHTLAPDSYDQSLMSGPPAIGIDLGSSYSCVGVYDSDGKYGDDFHKVVIIPNEQGNRTTPSYVAFTETGRLVGDAAKNQANLNSYNTIWNAKCFLGRKFDDLDFQPFIKRHAPFKIREKSRKPVFDIETSDGNKLFTPEEVMAMVIPKLKLAAEVFLNRSIHYAVISVPACFNAAQRQAVRDAGFITGLGVLRLIDEADAAAFAYCVESRFTGERNL